MVPTVVVEEVQVTDVVMSCVLPSLYLPIACIWRVNPTGSVGSFGLIVIDTSDAGGFTVNDAEPTIEPEVALIVAVPCATAVATPWVPVVLLSVATDVGDALHCTEVVRSFCVPSL